ncbi:MAG: NTP transferase domain-containing protein [Clostridia bacterium]|nr:NTP transferase domain-containing protein [Clostridia bacterium]
MKHSTLVILAGGLGSRFGGNKQISCVGPSGECLMEYSIYDALEAGFDRVVFILKSDMVDTVREKIGNRLSSRVRVDYAVQDYTSIPSFYHIPAERTKPFGTVHALLCAKEYLDAPFATINADDYYGKDAYRILKTMLDGLSNGNEAVMVPYILGNTMSENGGVTRGVCAIRDGVLQSVSETKNIHYGTNREILSDAGALSPELPVSMNIWGFHPAAIPQIEAYFEAFLKGLSKDELKAECLLPIMVNDFLSDGKMTVRAQASNDCWFGLTYREDIAVTEQALRELHQKGFYPDRL